MSPEAAGSLPALREANRRRVVDLLRCHGVLSQAEIARSTGLSRATVSNIVRDLGGHRLISVAPARRGGRHVVEVSLHPGSGVAVGVDFGHRHLRAVVADVAHRILAEESVEVDVDHSAQTSLDHALTTVKRLLAGLGAQRQLVGVGVGLPGPIERSSGTVTAASILPGWAGYDVAGRLGAELGTQVAVDNDANLGALAELVWGAGRGCTDLAYLKVATGIGAGLVLRGEIYRGAAGTAGEIGHTTIDEMGALCRCGNRGCLETLAGAPAILDLVRGSRRATPSLREVLELSAAGDMGCRRVIADAGQHIGVAVANLCNLLSPQRVIIGGDLAGAGATFFDSLRLTVARRAIRMSVAAAEIVPGELGERAEALGAVALVLRSAELGGPAAAATAAAATAARNGPRPLPLTPIDVPAAVP